MTTLEFFIDDYFWYIILISIIVLWDFIWKLLALWRAAGKGRMVWFICIAVIISAGILPIIYLLFFQRIENESVVEDEIIIEETEE